MGSPASPRCPLGIQAVLLSTGDCSLGGLSVLKFRDLHVGVDLYLEFWNRDERLLRRFLDLALFQRTT